jgi:uncharacterized SAM-dependent methyltransferase
VLRNVNVLLQSDFDVADWRHIAYFNPAHSRVEMHVQARRDLAVRWPGAERAFSSGERIHTENSYKYTPDTLRQMLKRAGFAWVALYTDDVSSFTVALAGA